MDRRTLDRTRVDYPIKLAIGAGSESIEIDATLVDHSVEGARLLAKKPIKLETQVRLLVSGEQFGGIVRYCTHDEARGGFIIGVRLE